MDRYYYTSTPEGKKSWELLTASGTGADILTALLTVDGAGSGLDADFLDGHDSSYFQEKNDNLDSLSGLSYSSVSFVKMTGENTFALDTAEYLNLASNSEITGTIKITGTSKAAGRLYAGATNPSNNTRLNYDGYFYAKKLYSEATEVSVVGHQHSILHYSGSARLEATSAGATLTGNLLIGNGNTIGQAAGPLLTFDDSNNYLGITGCKVGINTATPATELEISKATNGAVLRLSNTDAAMAAGETSGEIEFWKIDATGGAGVVSSIKSISFDSGNAFGLGFSVGSVGTPKTNALFIRYNGYVGIGTTTPTSKLQVTELPIYANNAAAVAGGLTAGAFYRTNADPDPVCVVH